MRVNNETMERLTALERARQMEKADSKAVVTHQAKEEQEKMEEEEQNKWKVFHIEVARPMVN